MIKSFSKAIMMTGQTTRGLVPASLINASIETQVKRALVQIATKTEPIEKYIYLSNLRSNYQDVFYRLLIDNIIEICPFVYTPTVGQACQTYSSIYRNADALFLSYEDKGNLENVMKNWHQKDPKIAVVTDGGRILGLGDQGLQGQPITVGKLSLYIGGAGIKPEATLPIILDLGTDNEALLNDPLYLGLHRPRVKGEEMQEFMDEFYIAARKTFPKMIIQFEDFQSDNAFKYLERYRYLNKPVTDSNGNKFGGKVFNDDIQGTGAVILAGFINAIRQSGTSLDDIKVVVLGAASSAVGVSLQIIEHFTKNGFTFDQAKEKFYLVDSKGLVTDDRGDVLPEHKKELSRKAGGPQFKSLEDVVNYVKPTALIGLSAVTNAFNENIIRSMASFNKRPIIFPLSNPLTKSEASFEDCLKFTNGSVIFASGSPFTEVIIDGKLYEPNQGNNFYTYPGIGYGSIISETNELNDDMIYEASIALANSLNDQEIKDGLLYPRLNRIREISAQVAASVAKAALRTNVGQNLKLKQLNDDQLLNYIKSKQYDPN